MLPRSQAEDLLRSIDRRKRTLLAIWCVPMGIVIAELGLVVWAIANAGLGGLSTIAIGSIVAGVIGAGFGLLSVLTVPAALCQKPLKPAMRWLFLVTSLGMCTITAVTGFFPLFAAGVVLSLATIGIALWMPNESVKWSADRCVACGYDLSAIPSHKCPECGIAEMDVRAIADSRMRRMAPARGVIFWVTGVLAMWVAAVIWALMKSVRY